MPARAEATQPVNSANVAGTLRVPFAAIHALDVPHGGQIARDGGRRNVHVPGDGRLRPAFEGQIAHTAAALGELAPGRSIPDGDSRR